MADDIVVSGRRKVQPDAASDFMLERMMRDSSSMGGGAGGGGGRRPLTPTPIRAAAPTMGPRITPTTINQPRSTLGTLTGTAAPKGYGVKMSTRFKKGGKVKKMAKGGSTASKRGDGCATKGKTKGKLV